MYDVVEEPAMKVLPTASPEDLIHSHRSLLTSTLGAFLLAGGPREPENLYSYLVRAMRRCLRQAAEAGDVDALSPFPIIVKGQRNVHEPLPLSLYKDVKKSIRKNWLQSPYTNGLFQAITDSYRMAPCDWIALARTALTPAQFTVWHSEYSQRAGHPAAKNAQMNNPVTLPVLLGSGDFATTVDQPRLDPHASSHSVQIGLRAMKAVPDSQAREISSFTSIHQGAAEAYIDFIDRLQEAITRQVDNDRAAKSLLWQLAYENANKDCRTIIGPLRTTTKDTSEFIKFCQDVGTEKHKTSVLAAAIKGDPRCYNCGKPGHLHKDCLSTPEGRKGNYKLPLKDCLHCGKGRH